MYGTRTDASTPSASAASEGPDEAAFAFDDSALNRVLGFYFGERQSILRAIHALLRGAEDTSHAHHAMLADAAQQLAHSSGPTERPTLVASLVSQLKGSFAAHVPPCAGAGNEAPPDGLTALQQRQWASQLVWEQRELLQLLFLALYSCATCSSGLFIELMQVFDATRFGALQPNDALLDTDARRLQTHIGYLCVLIGIECMSLESALTLVTGESTLRRIAEHPMIGREHDFFPVHDLLCGWAARMDARDGSESGAERGAILLAWAVLGIFASIFDPASVPYLSTDPPRRPPATYTSGSDDSSVFTVHRQPADRGGSTSAAATTTGTATTTTTAAALAVPSAGSVESLSFGALFRRAFENWDAPGYLTRMLIFAGAEECVCASAAARVAMPWDLV